MGIIIATSFCLFQYFTCPREAGPFVPYPDFIIGVDPPTASIPPGGTTTVSLLIKTRNGYDEVIDISFENPPPFISVELSEDEADASGKSATLATIASAEKMPSGDYEITFVGEGGDGKRREASLLLTVEKVWREFYAAIDYPQDGECISAEPYEPVQSYGRSSGYLPEGEHAWLCIQSSKNSLIWPQFEIPQGDDQEWELSLNFGAREEYYILILIVGQFDHERFEQWRHNGMKTGDWPGLSLPRTAKIYEMVTINNT